jgi:hypothetical protein
MEEPNEVNQWEEVEKGFHAKLNLPFKRPALVTNTKF